MTSGNPDIVLIHGLWMTPLSWENWKARYEGRGFTVHTPAWPGMEGTPEELRRDPSPIARQNIPNILDHYETIIRGLDRPPIIMGHSFGGGFTQVLLDRGLGSAGVGVDAASVKGIRDLPLSTLKSGSEILRNPFARHKAIPFSLEKFNYAFTNDLTLEESRPAWERYAVPGSRNVLLTLAYMNIVPKTPLTVNWKSETRAPLLFIAGGNDHVVPASANRHNADKYKTKSITAYKEFPGRTHNTVNQNGWEEVADFALDWALNPRPL